MINVHSRYQAPQVLIDPLPHGSSVTPAKARKADFLFGSDGVRFALIAYHDALEELRGGVALGFIACIGLFMDLIKASPALYFRETPSERTSTAPSKT